MGVPALLSIVTLIVAVIISGKALLSKSELEQVFLTHEQKIKMHYYKLFGLSGLIAFLVSDLYILWSITINKKTAEMVNWSFAFGIALVIFICCLISLGTIERFVQNFLIMHHFKYKVTLNNFGDVYILRMMNQEVCICSKDPNVVFLRNDDIESILVKVDDLLLKPLTKERLQKPNKSFWQKVLE
ncbi:hypothetical protein [uncultured Psychrobacillus sp.]|uniref:hypothetical protein n=1 Tax=uncultured Psychrobacillus sp. TaxID=1551585 RepID=UPI002618A093|nr:hypothetical protein [uncultured Psychrobacillus sp.]